MKVRVRTKKSDPNLTQNQSEKKKSPIIRKLEEYKIIFDTLLPCMISVISLVVSVIALCQSCRSASDESMLNLPRFNITQQWVRKEIEIDGRSYPEELLLEYEIINQGGDLTSGKAEVFQIITITGKPYSGTRVVVSDKFKISSPFFEMQFFYAPDTKRFKIYRHECNDNISKMNSVEQFLESANPGYDYSYTIVDYAKVTDTDYRGDAHEEYYDLGNRRLVDKPEEVHAGEAQFHMVSTMHPGLTGDEFLRTILESGFWETRTKE